MTPIRANIVGPPDVATRISASIAACHSAASCSASLIGRLGSSAFRPSTTTVSTSLAGSCFSSESAPRPFHHGIRGRGGTIFRAALPSIERQVQADIRTHLIHRPARDIFPPPVELEFSPIGFDPERFSCCCCRGLLPGPPELGTINPDAVHDDGFSNRPFGVKRFQTIHHHSVDVARGLVLLFGIGTKALPSWDSRTGWNNLSGGLTVNRTTGPSGHTNSPHPSSREGHLPTARWNSSFLLSGLILNGFHAAAAAACSRVHRNSVPSTQMRCMMTANRRAKATIAFFIPRRLAICMAQALSHDHFFERSMLCAAS